MPQRVTNSYTIDAEASVVRLTIVSSNGTTNIATFDLSDLPTVQSRHWRISHYRCGGRGRQKAYVVTGAHPHRTTLGAYLLDVTSSTSVVVAYRDRDPLNCRRSNLAVEQRDALKRRIVALDGDDGTCIDATESGKYAVQIMRYDKGIHLGTFDTREIAVAVRDAFRLGERYRRP